MTELKLLSKEEKAKQLNIDLKTLYNWVKKGKIDFVFAKKGKRKQYLP